MEPRRRLGRFTAELEREVVAASTGSMQQWEDPETVSDNEAPASEPVLSAAGPEDSRLSEAMHALNQLMAWRWRLDRAAWGDLRAWRQAAWRHGARLVPLVLGGGGGRDAGSVDRASRSSRRESADLRPPYET